jgi:hypothetical protein
MSPHRGDVIAARRRQCSPPLPLWERSAEGRVRARQEPSKAKKANDTRCDSRIQVVGSANRAEMKRTIHPFTRQNGVATHSPPEGQGSLKSFAFPASSNRSASAGAAAD